MTQKSKYGRPAWFWQVMDDERAVKCQACFRGCVIPDGRRGYCLGRKNLGGELYSLNYGFVGAIGVDPVEKKPLYHFRPGTTTFSLGAPGCNLSCRGCQNNGLSHPGLDWPGVLSEPGLSVALAMASLARDADSCAFTYSEPTVFVEFALDVAHEVYAAGMDSIWVTNGSMTPEVMKSLQPAVVALNIDLKGFTEKFYKEVTGGSLKVVTDNIELALSLGMWVEVTTLLIPGLNDSDGELAELSGFLAGLSADLPWHISRFFPRHLQKDIPVTPEESLRRAREIGHDQGLKHVYIGNAEGSGYSDTICPNCSEKLVERKAYGLRLDLLSGVGHCPKCRTEIPGRWFKRNEAQTKN
ncbi:MAG: AmmeMemoRadiSam system radical SAM enzyme [Deltaproteobacteria bacterium]|jgi:pyruvate formate lyase activating enzyme|nr:AmmeMemoRadiSam system radical SAM enzyme [Deltaproteobacteria bacterium]